MYGLLINRRHIERILSGTVDEFWGTLPIAYRGHIAFIDEDSDMVLGFADLEDVIEMPFSEYLQYYGVKRHRWESVPVRDGRQKAYRFVFHDPYRVTNPRKIIHSHKNTFLIEFDERGLEGVRKQSSLFDY